MNTRFINLTKQAKIITDVLGRPIDKGILKLNVLLNYHGIRTIASCYGHRSRPQTSVWVDIIETDNSLSFSQVESLFNKYNLELTYYNTGDNIPIEDKTLRVESKKKKLRYARRDFKKILCDLKKSSKINKSLQDNIFIKTNIN